MIKLKDLLNETITIDVKVGDTILTGRFKNKKTVVKKIGVDNHGMPTINGRKVATFRMGKKVNVFDKELVLCLGNPYIKSTLVFVKPAL